MPAPKRLRVNGRLSGRVAIVTGSGHGIGKAYALRLASEGANVVVADIDGAAAASVRAECQASGVEAIGVAADIATTEGTQGMARSAVDTFGRIDILVNNAAMFSRVPMSRVPFDEITEDEWDRLMSVNVRGMWLACRAVVPHMKEGGYGKIINIGSSTVWERTGTRIHYVTSKAAVIGFTRTLATELGPFNIGVNCVAPGSTLSEEEPGDAVIRMRTAATSSRAFKRVQRPEDLVGAVAFFASPDSDFITGQTLVVDGGAVMR
jgi:3-oxoacyl-[acyl-carrier protein] reductase